MNLENDIHMDAVSAKQTIRDGDQAAGLRVKTAVKAGNTLTPAVPTSILIKYSNFNHNQTRARGMRVLGAALAVAAGLVAPPAHAQNTAVFHGSPFNCTTAAGPASFAVTSWSVSAAPGKTVQGPLVVTKAIDNCSATLLKLANGGTMKAASLTVVDSKTNKTTVIELQSVAVSNYELSGGSSTTVESVAFAFQDISIH